MREMMKKATTFLLLFLKILTGITIVIHVVFLWVNANVDTNFYHAFAEFIRTGNYESPLVYAYKHPWTIEPPGYSALLALLYSIPRSDILLHAIQLSMLVVTSILVYKTLCLINPAMKQMALIAACLLILLPGNYIYVTYVMTEISSQFLLMLYVFLGISYLKTRSLTFISFAVLIGFMMGFLKFSLFVFGPLAMIVYFFQKPTKPVHIIPASIGIMLLIGWIGIHHQITGIWGITDSDGLRFNLKMMAQAKVLPPENHPSMKTLRKFVPATVPLTVPYWELEPYINPNVGYDFHAMDKIVGDVGKAALLYHPLAFIKASLETVYLINKGDPPYAQSLRDAMENTITDPLDPLFCYAHETMQYCSPLIRLPYSTTLWIWYLNSSDVFYRYFYPIWSLILFPLSMVYITFKGSKFTRLFVILWIIGMAPIAAFSIPQTRYAVLFYPVMMCITCSAWSQWQSKRINPPKEHTNVYHFQW
jgi:hypothetical protein